MRRRLIAAAVLALAGLAGVVPAGADIAQPAVVSTNPVDWTPHILDACTLASQRQGAVRKLPLSESGRPCFSRD